MRSFATIALDQLTREFDHCRAERAHVVAVLTTFKESELSISSVQPLYALLDELLDGPREKESVCPPL